MKRLALGLAAVVLLASCAGLAVRENVLIPAMRMAWVGISADIHHGFGALTIEGALRVEAEMDLMAASLETGDIGGILMADWPLLKKTAQAGIALRLRARSIGPGVAKSLHERVRVFTQALEKLGAAR